MSLIFAVSFILLQVCMIVEGRYLLQVELFGYSNPTGRCKECQIIGLDLIGCCDQQLTNLLPCLGVLRCDSYFSYCLRPIGSEGENCSYFGSRMSTANRDDGHTDFAQGTVLGLENPLQLQGLTANYAGVQLYIEVRDQDPDIMTNDPELIDIVLINHRSAIGQASRKQNYTGVYGFVTMDLSVTALCAPNFEGTYCMQCVAGFTGPNCDIEVDNCVGVKCSGNGECVDGIETFSCTCDPGFTGEFCQTNVDDCVGVNCSGNGECFDGVNDFTCECISGYGGPLCSEAIKETSMIVMIIAVAVGGGAVFLVTVIVLLMAAICWLTKNHKKVDTSHGASTEQHHDEDQLEEDKNLEVQEQSAVHHAEQLIGLKSNEAYGCSSQQVPTEENVAYGQAMLPQISTKENVAYGHTTHESS